MTNFDFLRSEHQFASFAEVAISAERILHIDPAACALNCRRAMEFAVKWLYSVDKSLDMPDHIDQLARLMDAKPFRKLVGQDLWRRMKLIRSLGNNAAHDEGSISREQAELCLENLFDFMDFIACCYGSDNGPREFDPGLLDAEDEEEPSGEASGLAIERLMAENAALRAQLTARREAQARRYVPRPLDSAEYKTRRIYIEAMLLDAGWQMGRDCRVDVELPEGFGAVDYLLYGGDGKPLAIIEARRSCMDIAKGREQADFCAELLEKQHGRRPVIFLTDGFDVYINDGSERRIAAIYSRRDLERRLSLSAGKLGGAALSENIAGRDYQRDAVAAACAAFDDGPRRALLAMASGTGKTHIAAALCELMLRLGRAKTVLYLSENATLATQAARSFAALLPDAERENLCDSGCDNEVAAVNFATWAAMENIIDDTGEGEGRRFTCGCFDLVICDEAHGAALERHRDVFNYFDAPMLAMTAAPTELIDAAVYELFGINGAPTYSYDMARAVRDGYLLGYRAAEVTLKRFAENSAPEALHSLLYNRDSIREAMKLFMAQALRVNRGKKLGKTIIFAASSEQAGLIFEVFRELNPRLTGYAKVVDAKTPDPQAIIDRFADPKRLPQIVISVGALESGADLPHVLNLVFLRRVTDKARFWQMIGRGARPCPGIMNGVDKDRFYIFDFCGNFEYFRSGKSGLRLPLPGEIFVLKARLVCALQEPEHRSPELSALRLALTEELAKAVDGLDRDSFSVRQHLRYVEFYSEREHYSPLTEEDTELMARELAPLMESGEDEAALAFQRLVYKAELAVLENRAEDESLALIKHFLPGDAQAGVTELEALRLANAGGFPKLPAAAPHDEILSVRWHDSQND